MTYIVPTRTPPLAPANPDGNGGECSTTLNANGDAVFESRNYEITVTSNSQVTIRNLNTGEVYQVAGDPHVSVDGVQAFDFHETMTFMLNDGTKVTMNTSPWGNSGATVVSRVTITNADAQYGVEINGASLSDGRDISFEETTSLGMAKDAEVPDGMLIFENARGAGFVRYDPATQSVVAVDQASVNAMETAMAADPNSPANPKGSNPKGTPMTSITSSAFATFDTSFLARLNGDDASAADVSTWMPQGSYTSDGAYVTKLSAGGSVAVSQPGGPGTDVEVVLTATNGVKYHMEFERDAKTGLYVESKVYVSGMGDAGKDALINQHLTGAGHRSLLSALQLTNSTTIDPSKKKKGQGAGGADGGADGGMGGLGGFGGMTGASDAGGTSGVAGQSGDSSNWFIALAEGMGEILNKLAKELKSAVDAVTLDDNGQPPYKEGMRIQGLAQQLQFISQAFLTALNSVGEATKSVVTAGGAAR
jgi:Domain of Unknown Function (DUF1521)